jgi:hypothetical protein
MAGPRDVAVLFRRGVNLKERFIRKPASSLFFRFDQNYFRSLHAAMGACDSAFGKWIQWSDLSLSNLNDFGIDVRIAADSFCFSRCRNYFWADRTERKLQSKYLKIINNRRILPTCHNLRGMEIKKRELYVEGVLH